MAIWYKLQQKTYIIWPWCVYSTLALPFACRSSSTLLRAIPTVDRISYLPDSILCHILSFVPTKLVAITSVLSKRWEQVWLSVLALYFDQEAFIDFNSFHNFVSFHLPLKGLILVVSDKEISIEYIFKENLICQTYCEVSARFVLF